MPSSAKVPFPEVAPVVNNGTGQPPIQQTSNTETDPQTVDVSGWTWIAVVVIVAIPIISLVVLLKSNNRKLKMP
jgi:hypothetical protein